MRRKGKVLKSKIGILLIMLIVTFLMLSKRKELTIKSEKDTFNQRAYVDENYQLTQDEIYSNEDYIEKDPLAGVLSPALPAVTIVDTILLGEDYMNEYFSQIEIAPTIYNRIYGKSYKENCPIPLEELRYLKVLYYGFDKETHIGEMIVNREISEDVVNIFKELYEVKYPIEKMQLVDIYDADDIVSMSDNNTSAFNFRYIDGTTRYSNHAKGLAVDINPRYNPYVRNLNGKSSVLPSNGEQYADRNLVNEYYIAKDDICYEIFVKYGFTWGGDWKNSKDYQHFEKVN